MAGTIEQAVRSHLPKITGIDERLLKAWEEYVDPALVGYEEGQLHPYMVAESLIGQGAPDAVIFGYLSQNWEAERGAIVSRYVKEFGGRVYAIPEIEDEEAQLAEWEKLGFVPSQEPSYPAEERIYTPEEALAELGISEESLAEAGITPEEGWSIRYTPPVNGGLPQFSYIGPDNATTDLGDLPEMMIQEAATWMEGGGLPPEPSLFSDEELLYAEYVRTGGQLEMEDWTQHGAPIRPDGETIGGQTIDQIRGAFNVVFPDTAVGQLFAQMQIDEQMPYGDVDVAVCSSPVMHVPDELLHRDIVQIRGFESLLLEPATQIRNDPQLVA